MNFQLDIYTYPAGRGVACDCRTSHHTSPDEAIAHLEAQTTPYAYACLQASTWNGYTPCDWDGKDVMGGEWPVRYGTNTEHPAYTAAMADWDNLKAEVRRQHKAAGGKIGSIEIAGQLLKARHPEVQLAHRLGCEAFGINPALV